MYHHTLLDVLYALVVALPSIVAILKPRRRNRDAYAFLSATEYCYLASACTPDATVEASDENIGGGTELARRTSGTLRLARLDDSLAAETPVRHRNRARSLRSVERPPARAVLGTTRRRRESATTFRRALSPPRQLVVRCVGR
jgi:hypothetical protein